jgi:UDP-N-acetylmuramoylalanine--D-glutamate ligase
MYSTTEQSISQQQELLNARLKMQGDDAHCFETVCENNGVTWINHSIATTTDLAWAALRDVEGPVVLIIGGTDRANDHYKLSELIKQKVTAVVCLGTTPWKYVEAFSGSTHLIIRATYIQEAVKTANMLSKNKAKTVLFAPGCPSYDAFDNYRNRGNSFRDAVKTELNIISK